MGGISALKNFWSNGLRVRVNILSDFFIMTTVGQKVFRRRRGHRLDIKRVGLKN